AAAPAASHPLSLHDALPIWEARRAASVRPAVQRVAWAGLPAAGRRVAREEARRVAREEARRGARPREARGPRWGPRTGAWPASADRKSTRLNSSHQIISYAG